ncbi:unspecified product [Leptomonas pyrrhocoris]|uniref:Unspecified product n=1 Tax=Leptomonas pyrrhocoris TaxID=157538 RepID=A0A0M9GAU4_LEPPY|nr:unspecified product [Leptomonas pyrrhocoris]XP_015664788.1 unspecified product [Leptomonas pyrrhocoris]KPA86348.1 unspecified product [Leptomonas pyrrhocoris]KPA86349.1 unspecified product [Leptomonas pyrrhocoris]|eukprot:XP_015664787.1 unspecified product [Leptomonas pyrrhocoris]
MFRSWGEFNSCATEVFHLFAEPLVNKRREVLPSPGLVRQSNSSTTVEEVGLRRAGMECAFYVLFGRYPSPTLLTDCFGSAFSSSPSHVPAHCHASRSSRVPDIAQKEKERVFQGYSPEETATGLHYHSSRTKLICLEAFLRFVRLCAEEEGPGLVAARPQPYHAMNAEPDSSDSLSLPSEAGKAATLQCWRQFESVAGAKGYITLEDVRSISMQHPFQDVRAVLEEPTLSASVVKRGSSATKDAELSRRQKALAQHVLWIMDRDHDGKVCFDDVKPYLLGSV